ncbi:MAG: DUF4040 domain-containing protein [Robiginitomaculum sp.]
MFTPIFALEVGLMAMLVVVAIAVVRMRSLFAIVMLQGVYSLLSAIWFVVLDAVDVAFTEAAVGAGVSTVFMLGAMLLTDRDSKPISTQQKIVPLLIVVLAGAAMFYAIGYMPAFGDATAIVNSSVGAAYVEATKREMFLPNVVTAVLASYRGFDTFGETTVVFMAGLGILLLLGLNGHAGQWRAKPNGHNIGNTAPNAKRDDTQENSEGGSA